MAVLIREGQMENLLDSMSTLKRCIHYLTVVNHPETTDIISRLRVIKNDLDSIVCKMGVLELPTQLPDDQPHGEEL